MVDPFSAMNIDIKKLFWAGREPLPNMEIQGDKQEGSGEGRATTDEHSLIQLHPLPVEPGAVRITVVPDTDPFLVMRSAYASHFTLHIESESILCVVCMCLPYGPVNAPDPFASA